MKAIGIMLGIAVVYLCFVVAGLFAISAVMWGMSYGPAGFLVWGAVGVPFLAVGLGLRYLLMRSGVRL